MNRSLLLLFILSCLCSLTMNAALMKKKTNLKTQSVVDDVVNFANKATSILKDVSASGQTVSKKLSPLKEYYNSLESVLGNFKGFLVNQTNTVMPSVSDSQNNFNEIESKFTTLSTLTKTVQDAINKYGNYLPNTDATGKFKEVSERINNISQKITKYKGYSDEINNIIKDINEHFNVMKKFDDDKIVEMKKYIGDFDTITNKVDNANKYVNELIEVTSKAANVKNTLEQATNTVSNLFGNLW